MGVQCSEGQSGRGNQQRWRRMKVAAAIALAAAGIAVSGQRASADVTLASDWNPVPNSNGYTYYDGFTNYSGNPIAQVDIGGNKWLQLDAANPYWGQFTGQMWANNTLATSNFNTNPHLEFDINLKDWHWGNLD